jgi:hypothetical protein
MWEREPANFAQAGRPPCTNCARDSWPAYAQIRTACKKTETAATGTQQTQLDKANAALVDELGQARRCDQIAHDRDSYPGKYTVYGSTHVTGIAAC